MFAFFTVERIKCKEQIFDDNPLVVLYLNRDQGIFLDRDDFLFGSLRRSV